jgi:hypothetical protein
LLSIFTSLVSPYRRVAERFLLINHCAVIGVDGVNLQVFIVIVNSNFLLFFMAHAADLLLGGVV